MFDHALLLDTRGNPICQHHRTYSRDWDEVRAFCDTMYMPYHVQPLGRFFQPDATMYSAKVGRITVTRFSYGVPVHLKDFNPEAGNILVLTTLKGALRHGVDRGNWAVTTTGESFVADCSRTDYWLDGDARHLQLNLTIPHHILEKTALQWFGFIPGDRLWKSKVKFGGNDSSWLALLDYLIKSVAEMPDLLEKGKLGIHLEQAICIELLKNWAGRIGYKLAYGERSAAPHYVRRAERFMSEHTKDVPTLGEVAENVGVSVRALTGAFRRFRNMTPMGFLREKRLQGIRKELLDSRGTSTVSAIVSRWGYANFGVFAKSYKDRFGELPSETLRKVR